MTRAVTMAVAAALGALVATGGPAEARWIERACNASDRAAANPAICACIQRVADQMLTNADQRKAARFFTDPQRAQEVRKSDTPADDAFWARWRDFGRAAGNVCN